MARTDASNWIVAEVLDEQLDLAADADSKSSPVTVEELPERAMGVMRVADVGADADETLDAVIVGRDSADDAWETVGTFEQATQGDGAQTLKADIQEIRRQYAVEYTVAGTTPAFDVTVLLVGDKLGHAGGKLAT